ncbi:uncharacterized protein CEXT_721581 [Caerostris extrusa]|uniref:Uncharacterized protein n=1 Tax=Caerostris extrusa TaxID=172846 RepID=A0AAV4M7X6_CAEEX|nr:uncharacterized protein CEXT_721581 [Caerostris extrusa]
MARDKFLAWPSLVNTDANVYVLSVADLHAQVCNAAPLEGGPPRRHQALPVPAVSQVVLLQPPTAATHPHPHGREALQVFLLRQEIQAALASYSSTPVCTPGSGLTSATFPSATGPSSSCPTCSSTCATTRARWSAPRTGPTCATLAASASPPTAAYARMARK